LWGGCAVAAAGLRQASGDCVTNGAGARTALSIDLLYSRGER